MKAFEYAAPRTESEILELLSPEPGQTELLAGGTDLVGLMNKMIVQPDRIVYIEGVDSMRIVDRDPATGEVILGAVVHLDELLEHPYLQDYPAITQAIAGINSMQLQAQGTLGGELCRRPMCWFYRSGRDLLEASRLAAEGDNRYHAILGNAGPAKYVHPSRIAPALIALGAAARVIGPAADDEAFVPVADFFRAPRHAQQRETILAPNQVLTHLILPPAQGGRSATYEVRQSDGPDMPLAAAAVSLEMTAGVVTHARVVLGQVAPVPWVSGEAAAQLIGQPVNERVADLAADAAVARATPLSDNAYKVQLARTAVRRAILRAAGMETGGL
jgi:xanthine dehydrogenase YagS FAD-binding subunit